VQPEGKFYIGREYDLAAQKILGKPVHYDSNDLTTHGVIVGMTGSGKTGLGVGILEEAALQGLPAIIIDPKGDISNLPLHFPDFRPGDFEAWIDPAEAKRSSKSVEALAEELASRWREGLQGWGLSGEDVERVISSVAYTIFTPGSTAGVPVDILTSLKAPDVPWEQNRELLLDKVSSTATALLTLVGVEADPVRSREHILLANIFEEAWKSAHDLDLPTLIQHVQQPPFEKLGALDLERSYPEDDRFELAMTLNNLLASPTFEVWTEGAPLDVDGLLWMPDGRPRHSIFYLAHLSDQERMFFVTLLLSTVEAWMRAQSGASALKALLYIDEMYGFLPPVAKPPSKPPLLRLLKQARAYGLGLLLTTQNPVDLDYKGLSNAGTWFVGKLQTEQDKARLLDGLEGVAVGEAEIDRNQLDKSISALGKRVFLLHNVHRRKPQIFYTRWAMAFLKGPIALPQVEDVNKIAGASVPARIQRAAREDAETPIDRLEDQAPTQVDASPTRAEIPARVEEAFLANTVTASQAAKISGQGLDAYDRKTLVYRPGLLAQAKVRYLKRDLGVDVDQQFAALVPDPGRRGVVRWEEFRSTPVPREALDDKPAPEGLYGDLPEPLRDAKVLRSLESDFLDYVYHTAELRLLQNESLELTADAGESEAAFQQRCEQRAWEKRDEESDEIREKYEKKIKRIQDKLIKEERELEEDQAELAGRKLEEYATHAENILGLFTGSRSRRRVSSSLTKRRLTSKAKADVEESQEEIEEFRAEMTDLEVELAEVLEEFDERWEEVASDIRETVIKPYKKYIQVDFFGIAWLPYWNLEGEDGQLEAAGFALPTLEESP
jgi:hypothetical protein